MKKLVSVQEVEGEGFTALLGKTIVVFCMNYIYTGILEGVKDSCVLLSSASIVYETGPHNEKSFADAQKLSHPLYIQLSSVESFSETIKK